MNKNFKKFLRNLIICILIKEILHDNISIEEAYILMDSASEAQRIEKEKKKRDEQIREMNERFIAIRNRLRNSID